MSKLMNSTKYQAYVKTLYERAKQYYNQGVAAYQKKDLEGVRAALRAVKQVWRDVNEYHIADNMFANTTAFENTRSSIGEYKKYIKTYIERLEQMVARLESIDSQGTGDARTDNFGDTDKVVTSPSEINDLGGLRDYVRTQLGNTSGTEQKGYLDMLAQLLSQQQQYQWQKESDDLAYSRTNQYALVAQLVSMGMSRMAAIQAVAGSAGDVAGSGVGASLSPDLAGTGLGLDQLDLQQQGQLQNYMLGMDANNNTRAAINQQQQLITEQARALALQNQQFGDNLAALDAIKETYGHVYGIHAYGFTVPTWATISQTRFKDWLRDARDWINEMDGYLNGGLFHFKDDSGADVYCKVYKDENGDIRGILTDSEGEIISQSGEGSAIVAVDFLLTTAKHWGAMHEAALAYDSIQKNIDNPYYGTWFENFFLSNAGPRAYHEQEEASEFEMNRLKVAQGALTIQQFQQDMFSAEATSAVQANIALVLQEGGDDAVYLNKLIKDNGWVVDPSSGQVVDGTGQVVSGFDLFKTTCPEAAMFFMEQFRMLNQYQVLQQATDKEVFNYTLEGLRIDAKNKKNQAEIQERSLEYAAKWFKNSSFLSGASAVKMVLDLTGASAAAGAMFNVASQVATGGANALIQGAVQQGLEHTRHVNRMQESQFNQRPMLQRVETNIGGVQRYTNYIYGQ